MHVGVYVYQLQAGPVIHGRKMIPRQIGGIHLFLQK